MRQIRPILLALAALATLAVQAQTSTDDTLSVTFTNKSDGTYCILPFFYPKNPSLPMTSNFNSTINGRISINGSASPTEKAPWVILRNRDVNPPNGKGTVLPVNIYVKYNYNPKKESALAIGFTLTDSHLCSACFQFTPDGPVKMKEGTFKAGANAVGGTAARFNSAAVTGNELDVIIHNNFLCK